MDEHKITFTYLNIRQSISILLVKLILADLLLAAIVVTFYFGLVQGEDIFGVPLTGAWIFLFIFGIIGIFKILLSIFVVLQWLTEYYEITPEEIIHKKGIIFRKVEKYQINNIRRIDIQNSLLGEIFNYATISVYDTRLNKYLDMFLVHNPNRYVNVLKQLSPHIEQKSDHTALPFMPITDE